MYICSINVSAIEPLKLLVATAYWSPDGDLNAACTKFIPLKSSIAPKVTFTTAELSVTSTESGVNEK